MSLSIRLIRHFSALACSGFGAIYLYNDLYRMDKYKSKLELKINDNTVNVPDKINNLISEVMTEMKVKNEDKTRITPFITNVTDTLHLGSLGSKIGPFLGIPYHFSIDEADNVAYTVWVDQVRIPQNSPETQALKQSVILSKNAKKFAIAREIYGVIFSRSVVKAVLPIVVILNFSVCSLIIQKFGKNANRLSVKPHAILLLSGAFIYILLLNVFSYYADAEIDVLVCNLGKSYVEGGVEYYEKMLEKNKGIKKLNKDTSFNDDGDLMPSLIVNPQMPIKNRLLYLNDVISGKNKDLSPWAYVFPSIRKFYSN